MSWKESSVMSSREQNFLPSHFYGTSVARGVFLKCNGLVVVSTVIAFAYGKLNYREPTTASAKPPKLGTSHQIHH